VLFVVGRIAVEMIYREHPVDVEPQSQGTDRNSRR
jgi:hypothetical protein